MSLRMRRVALEILAGVNELAIALRARAVVVDLDFRDRVAVRIVHVQIGAGMIHDPASSGGRMADVEIAVVRVPPQVLAGRRARVKVTDSFVVRKKVDARANPEWSREIPFQLDEPPEVAGTRRIDPQIARRPAAITFPARRVERIATENAAAVRRE